MSVTFQRTVYDGRQQAFWRGEAKMLPNGYTLANAIAAGTVLLRGTFVHIDTDNQTGAVIKVALVEAGGTTSAVRVEKGSYIQAGDTVMVLGGDASTTVTSVDTSNDGYDIVNLSAALTAATEGAYLIESDGADTPAAAYLPNAVLGADREIETNDLATLDVAYDAVVLKNVIPSFPTAWLGDGGLNLANNPKIIFIHS